MKALTILVFFSSLVYFDVSAQDSIKRPNAPTRAIRRYAFTKKTTPQEAISLKIQLLLDSLANVRKGGILNISTVRVEIENILYPYWTGQTLLGTKRSEAYFIHTGLQTMTQTDLQNGRLLVTVGLALNEPAEFVLLYFEQIVRTKKLIND